MWQVLKAFRQWLGNLLKRLQVAWLQYRKTVDTLRGAPFVAMLLGLCALLLATRQGADLAVTASQGAWNGAKLVIAALIYGLQCWFWTRRIVERTSHRTGANWLDSRLQTWTPRLLGAAPFALGGWAVFRSDSHSVVLPWVLLGLAVVMGLGLWLRRRVVGQHANSDRHSDIVAWVSLGAAVALFVLFTVDPVGPSRALGAIVVVFLGLACITAMGAALLHRGEAWRLPVFPAVVLWAVFCSYVSDNHAIGHRAYAPERLYPIAGPPQTLDAAFTDWCAAQGAQCQPGGPPVPIVFVAAEGGASRAGYWAADVLGRLEDDPGIPGRFSRHVFAISSVSGGSVGAVAYVSTLHDNPNLAAGAVRPALASVAGEDFLSPAMAGLLFPDLMQRFIPFAVLPDRAETLERGFEAGWRAHCAPGDRCHDADLWGRGSFLSLWSHNSGWQPVLMVNGARQEDGRRIITSNIKIDPNDFPDAVDLHALIHADVGLSTAISNGARFPLVSPGGTLRWKEDKPLERGRVERTVHTYGHLLDGGYFDGGGVASMADIAAAVTRLAAARNIKLKPIFIEINNDSDSPPYSPDLARGWFDAHDTAELGKSDSHNLLIDLLGPLDGLYQARGAHGTATGMSLALEVMHANPTATASDRCKDPKTTVPAASPPDAAPPGKPPGKPPAPPENALTPPTSAAAAPPSYYLVHLCISDPKGMPMDWALSQESRDRADAALGGRDGCCPGVGDQLQAIAEALGKPKTP
jgi:hypothetical protein